MLAQSRTRALAIREGGRASSPPLWRLLAALGLAALVHGCAAAPPSPLAGADPSDPSAVSRPAAYRGVVGPYASQRPADPAAWRDQNERVAPAGKP